MNPSIALAAALAAGGLDVAALAQDAAAPVRVCAPRAGGTVFADPSPSAPFDASLDRLDPPDWANVESHGAKLDPKSCRIIAGDGHALTHAEVAALSRKPSAPFPPAPAAENVAAVRAAAARVAAVSAAPGYGGLSKSYDGARGGGEPPPARELALAPPPPDASLSGLLASEIRDRFSKDAVGRELLGDFAGPDGKDRLPAFVLVDLARRDVPAEFDRLSGQIWLNQRHAAQAVRAAIPKTGNLSDPAKLGAYLSAHPQARDAYLDEHDVTIFHELVHAWQQRRDARVDSVEGRDPVEWELEAYRMELRYFHQKVMRDPSLIDRAPDAAVYLELLRGYMGFRMYLVQLYQNSNGSSDFPTIEKILAKRAQAGRPAAARSLEALQGVDREYRRREEDFAAAALPVMQAEAYPRLIAYRESQDRPADALALALDAPGSVRSEVGPKAFDATRNFLEADPPAPLESRLLAWDAYLGYQMMTTDSNLLSPDLFALYRRDRRAAFEESLAKAAKARTKGERENAVAAAKSYVDDFPDKEELLRRLQAAAKPGSR
ncbi:MAG: hypothetical protein ACHQ49_07165 [Elusimicrobiota bacterium]